MMIFCALWFINLGGNQGGGIIVPIAMIFFQMDTQNAISLSMLSIFVSGLIRLIFVYKRHTQQKMVKGVW
jgi:uncharacterized membrane protein YfcA